MRIPLEMCPASNVQTGAATSIAEHPIGLLTRLRFRVTVNTDNRLMSGTSMTSEFTHLAEAFGYTVRDMEWFTVNAMKSAFLPFDERLALIAERDQAGVREAARRGLRVTRPRSRADGQVQVRAEDAGESPGLCVDRLVGSRPRVTPRDGELAPPCRPGPADDAADDQRVRLASHGFAQG